MRYSFRKDQKKQIRCPECDHSILYVAYYDPKLKEGPYNKETIKQCSNRNCKAILKISAPGYAVLNNREGVLILIENVATGVFHNFFTATNRQPIDKSVGSDNIVLEVEKWEDYNLN